MDLWNTKTPISEIEGLEIEIPDWIDQGISPSDVAAILQGGCTSKTYMPAVTYYQAVETMSEHGDDVLQYIENNTGELPSPPKDTSWSGLAVFYLSHAVEVWTVCVEDNLQEFVTEDEA